MSTIETKIVAIEILPHPNADKLAIARIGGEGGFECAVGLDQFKTGDLAIYVMPDSVLSEEMCTTLAEKSKIQIKGGRIRAINIRGVLSEGLCLNPSAWLDHDVKEGDDITKELGVTKYEPPHPSMRSALKNGKGINFHYKNENFKEYHCVEKFKKSPLVLRELSEDTGFNVVATIKYHGSNFRCGLVTKPSCRKSWWERLKGLFVKDDKQEFLVGSHNRIKVPTQSALKYGDYYNTDTWWRMAQKYDLEFVTKQISENETLMPRGPTAPVDVVIYAEVIGPGIQKGYDYGISPGQLELRVFDIMINGKYCDWNQVKWYCDLFKLPIVEEVYFGPWSLDVTKCAADTDEYNGKKYVREGIVIRPVIETWHRKCGRVIFKYLNEAYLLDKTNSDFH